MNTATKAADDAVDTFTADEGRRKSLRLYLSEAPIGDEYQTLTEAEWSDGVGFEHWCEQRGIQVWEPARLSG